MPLAQHPAAAAAAPLPLLPRQRKIFLGLGAMQARVARIEQQLGALQEAAEPLVEAVQAGDAEDLRSVAAALRRLRHEAEAVLEARDALIEEIHSEQSLLVQLDSSGVRDAGEDYEALDELEARLAANFGDLVAVIDAALDEADEMAAGGRGMDF
jgi:hypothetical protein